MPIHVFIIGLVETTTSEKLDGQAGRDNYFRFLALALLWPLCFTDMVGFFLVFAGVADFGEVLDFGGFPFAAGFCRGAGTAMGGAVTVPAFFVFFPFPATTGPAIGAAAAAALAPRPRFGGGGGGGGGGANGFRNFRVSVRERSFPSSSNMKTSRAILGYSGSCGVISSSVISGNGIFCCT